MSSPATSPRVVIAPAKPITSVLASYPQTDAFKHITAAQLYADDRQDELLAITEFYRNDRAVLLYIVTNNGQEDDVRHVYDWADQVEHSKRMSAPDLRRLSAALARLPVALVSPPIDRLVIISFHVGSRWVTRTYDSAALPEAMREIYLLVGERAETRHLHGRR
jgi:hypothetical protein